MKRKLLQLLSSMLIIAVFAAFIINSIGEKKEVETLQVENKINIVTTIYPVYLIALNLADQVDSIEIKSLIDRNTGCLHDYQLTAQDMKTIAGADILIINGGGMEGFLEDVITNYPQLTIIDASKGITMMQSLLTHDEEEEAGDSETDRSKHVEEEYNSHVWLNPELYEKQIENVQQGILGYINNLTIDQDNQVMIEQINQNTGRYMDEVEDLNSEMEVFKTNDILNKIENNEAVIFHEAFAYFAQRIGMKVSFAIELEPDTSLSAGGIANIVNHIKENKIGYLFTEEQYSDSIPKQIAEETDSKVYVIDSVVTGDGTKDSYLNAMRHNLSVLKAAVN